MGRLALSVCTSLMLAGCDYTDEDTRPGSSAAWYVDERQSVSATTTRFTARVTRIGCSSGRTGKVLPPHIEYGDDEIVLTFRVSPKIDSGTCEGNPFASYQVELAEPIANRTLVDGQCRAGEGTSTTAFCNPDEVRYPQPDIYTR